MHDDATITTNFIWLMLLMYNTYVLDLVGHMTLPAPHAPIYRPPFPLQLIVL